MAKPAKAAHAALKPKFDSLPAKAPASLADDWKKYREAAGKLLAGVGSAIESDATAKDRTSHATKKTELDTLRTRVNDAVKKQNDGLAGATSALRELNTVGTKIGQAVKSKPAGSEEYKLGRAIMDFSSNAQKEVGEVEAPKAIP